MHFVTGEKLTNNPSLVWGCIVMVKNSRVFLHDSGWTRRMRSRRYFLTSYIVLFNKEFNIHSLLTLCLYWNFQCYQFQRKNLSYQFICWISYNFFYCHSSLQFLLHKIEFDGKLLSEFSFSHNLNFLFVVQKWAN